MNQNSNKITNKNIMVENINRLLYQKNWSIRQLADEAELPYESVKKLVGGKVTIPLFILFQRFAMRLIVALTIF